MRAICARRGENWTWVNGSSQFSRTLLPALERALGLRRFDLPGTGTCHVVLVLEPADDEAGRELSSRLEDVAHSKHMAPGLSHSSSRQGPRRVPPVAIARMTGA